MNKEYGGSAFDRCWKKRDRSVFCTKKDARYWFKEGAVELQRIQSAKQLRKIMRTPNATKASSDAEG